MTGQTLARSACRRSIVALLVGVAIAALPPAARARAPEGFWDKSLRAWGAEDRQSPPAPGGIVFAGSSSIRLWPTTTSFPRARVLNRGLSGAQLDDLQHYAQRLVLQYEPKVVVFYGGENDIGAGAPPERVFDAIRTLVGTIHARLPAARIVLLSIKPSIALRARWPRVQELNRLLEGFAGADARIRWVDVTTPMLGSDGKPRAELFREDGLHMTPSGYKLWNRLVAPVLEAAAAEP